MVDRGEARVDELEVLERPARAPGMQVQYGAHFQKMGIRKLVGSRRRNLCVFVVLIVVNIAINVTRRRMEEEIVDAVPPYNEVFPQCEDDLRSWCSYVGREQHHERYETVWSDAIVCLSQNELRLQPTCTEAVCDFSAIPPGFVHGHPLAARAHDASLRGDHQDYAQPPAPPPAACSSGALYYFTYMDGRIHVNRTVSWVILMLTIAVFGAICAFGPKFHWRRPGGRRSSRDWMASRRLTARGQETASLVASDQALVPRENSVPC